MKAVFEDIVSKRGADSYLAYRYDTAFFPFLWHYHPEYELTLILQGSGERMVGDSHEYFAPGDLVLIGPDLPHTWVSESSSAAVVIQFSEAFIAPLVQYPECERIRQLLAQSSQGLFFPTQGLGMGSLLNAIERLPMSTAVGRITSLLDVLQTLAAASPQPLTSPYFQPAVSKKTEGRIAKVFQYIHRHSAEPIALKEMAALINLSESAFCKFFKRTTGKTFSDYLADIRIGHACHLLSESDDTISTIAWRCGFDSLTYFNRIFLRKKGVRPREFRKGIGG
ncbi:AraC family transcriptional regulator [Puia dinghuensis]|uniref:AraC family transcriptional regulator n=1 Tax=Puia dinghuensis TaxID=1792502 RepID=A0A8J2XWA6_9BACT|nr:AraC family transcriptional regulator [Puia dinghuensis]GGB24880.1 AraC family transcriptional regulator [Puia dinghuensis]